MKKGSGKMILIGGSIILMLGILIYLIVPYSPVKKEYWSTVEKFMQEYERPKRLITAEDLNVLPEALQNYFIRNGYVGIESASAVKFEFKDVNFSLGVNKPTIKIDYTAHDFVKMPTRVAWIDSRMFGIPFQGIDLCKDGKGSMRGVVAKHIQLFHTSFDIIDAAYLAECLMHPSLALQENITYRQLDDYRVEATIRINRAETTGVFNFNEDYEMTSCVVEQRLCAETNTYEKWSAITSGYKIKDGINRPTSFQAVWNFSSGDLVYFDGSNMEITFID